MGFVNRRTPSTPPTRRTNRAHMRLGDVTESVPESDGVYTAVIPDAIAGTLGVPTGADLAALDDAAWQQLRATIAARIQQLGAIGFSRDAGGGAVQTDQGDSAGLELLSLIDPDAFSVYNTLTAYFSGNNAAVKQLLRDRLTNAATVAADQAAVDAQAAANDAAAAAASAGTGDARPATPPAAPAIYEQSGIRFDDAGTVYDASGVPTGDQLTPDEVHALLSTCSLPAGDPRLTSNSASSSSSSSSSSFTTITGPTMTPVLPSIDEIPDGAIVDALNAVQDAGGDVTQPTVLIDQATNAPLAIAQVTSAGTVQVTQPSPSLDLGSIVNKITGTIDSIAGTLTNIGTQVKRVGNAVQGAAAGAQTGYNAPVDWKPILLGTAAVGGGLWLLSRLGRR